MFAVLRLCRMGSEEAEYNVSRCLARMSPCRRQNENIFKSLYKHWCLLITLGNNRQIIFESSYIITRFSVPQFGLFQLYSSS